MQLNTQYRVALLSDHETILALLKENDLPDSDIDFKKYHFIVAVANGELAGCIGAEIYRPHVLLRSLAVKKDFRGKGIADKLIYRLLDDCTTFGIEQVHLLTTTADKYFDKKGFKTAERNTAPDVIQATNEFSHLCPLSSVYMTIII